MYNAQNQNYIKQSWKYFKEQKPCLKSHEQGKVHEENSCNFHEAYLGLCYILIYSCITIQIITRVDDWTGWNHKHRYISTLPTPSLGVGVISKVDEFAATIILPPWVRDLFHFLNESWDYVTMCEKNVIKVNIYQIQSTTSNIYTKKKQFKANFIENSYFQAYFIKNSYF